MSQKLREKVHDGLKLRERLGVGAGEFAFQLHGWQVEALMNRRGVTIKALAERMGLTQKRVREVREKGLLAHDAFTALDWVEAVCGEKMDGFDANDKPKVWGWVHQRLEGLARPKGR
jgi:hypothetical protein